MFGIGAERAVVAVVAAPEPAAAIGVRPHRVHPVDHRQVGVDRGRVGDHRDRAAGGVERVFVGRAVQLEIGAPGRGLVGKADPGRGQQFRRQRRNLGIGAGGVGGQLWTGLDDLAGGVGLHHAHADQRRIGSQDVARSTENGWLAQAHDLAGRVGHCGARRLQQRIDRQHPAPLVPRQRIHRVVGARHLRQRVEAHHAAIRVCDHAVAVAQPGHIVRHQHHARHLRHLFSDGRHRFGRGRADVAPRSGGV